MHHGCVCPQPHTHAETVTETNLQELITCVMSSYPWLKADKRRLHRPSLRQSTATVELQSCMHLPAPRRQSLRNNLHVNPHQEPRTAHAPVGSPRSSAQFALREYQSRRNDWNAHPLSMNKKTGTATHLSLLPTGMSITSPMENWTAPPPPPQPLSPPPPQTPPPPL